MHSQAPPPLGAEDSDNAPRAPSGFWLAGAVLVGCTAATSWLDFHGALATHLVATSAFLVLVRRVLTGAWRPRAVHALAVAVVLRAVCLPHPPAWSDDIYRYIHEGQLVLAGENPYLVAPADVPIEHRGEYWDSINNPTIAAAYPPAVQYALAAGAFISPHRIGMQLVFGFLDLLVFIVLWRGLPRLGVRRERAVIHGFCPLLAIEFAGQGHSDSLAVLFLVLATMACARGNSWRAGAALAVSTAAKLIPVVLLPFVARSRRLPAAAAVFAIVLIALYLPFLASPKELLSGTEEYAGRWRGNDSLFGLVHAVTDWIVERGWFRDFDSVWLKESQRLAKLPVVAAGLALLWWCHRRRLEVMRVGYLFFAFVLAAAPTVHPWYAAFLVPFLCVYPNPGLLAFTGSVFLAYHVYPAWIAAERWEESTWVKVIEYAPFYLGLGWEAWSKRGSRRAAPPGR